MIVEIFAYLTAMVWQMVVEKTPTNKPATVTGQFYTLISRYQGFIWLWSRHFFTLEICLRPHYDTYVYNIPEASDFLNMSSKNLKIQHSKNENVPWNSKVCEYINWSRLYINTVPDSESVLSDILPSSSTLHKMSFIDSRVAFCRQSASLEPSGNCTLHPQNKCEQEVWRHHSYPVLCNYIFVEE